MRAGGRVRGGEIERHHCTPVVNREESQQQCDCVAVAQNAVAADTADLGQIISKEAPEGSTERSWADVTHGRLRWCGFRNSGRSKDGMQLAAEALAGRLGDGLEPVQVVSGRGHRNVSHGDRQHGQTGLHIGLGAIPAQQDVDGIGMAQVVDPRQTSSGGADPGGAEQAPQSIGRACSRKRRLCAVTDEWPPRRARRGERGGIRHEAIPVGALPVQTQTTTRTCKPSYNTLRSFLTLPV